MCDEKVKDTEVTADAASFLREAFPRKFCGIKTIPTTETDTFPQSKKLWGL
jgi:hypothetical protein